MALFESAQDALDYEQMLNMLSQGFPVQRPKAVLFGDSMSEYVGYTADGNPDNKYGNSVADVIANNLGIQVQNLATGGETSNEALAGGAKFGAFQSYIEQNRPEYAIIRYGAADAIKNQDPAVTLQSVQQMVDIARANGVTPIIVGVSELYGAQNSKTGNIAGYIDPGAEQRANQINAGLRQLAEANGLSFTDVREATSAGTGDLLDGVHTNADFGKKMADAISEDIAAKNVIAEARVPQLPPNVDSLSSAEKGRLYNSLIDQGFTDAQIRTAARAESDQDWNALKQIAANVRNTTATAIEQQANLQTPQSAANVGEPVMTQQFSGLFGSGDVLANKAQEVLAASGRANDPRFADAIVGSFTQNGVTYNVQGDGSIQGIIETPTGAYLAAGFTPTGQQATEQLSTRFEETDLDRVLGILANAAIAAGTGFALGPAGVGALGAPGAAAAGAGITNFANTGDLQQALKAAGVGAAAAAGVQGIMSGFNSAAFDQAFAAADAAQLANQGLNATAIAQNLATYVDPATATALANAAANQAFALADANQLVKQGLNTAQITQVLQASGVSPSVAASVAEAAADGVTQISPTELVSNLKFQPQTGQSGQLPRLPDVVEVTGQRVTGLPFDLDALGGGLLSSGTLTAIPDSLVNPITQQVQVTGQQATQQTTQTTPSVAGGAVPVSMPTQQVSVTAQPAGQNISADTASGVLSSLLGQPVSVAGSTQQVQVTGQTSAQQVSPEVAAALISAAIGQQVVVSGSSMQPTSLPSTTGAALGSLVPVQTVPVTGQTISSTAATPSTTGASAGSLLPTQTVPVTAQTLPTTGGTPSTTGAAAGSLVPTQTVPVTGQTLPSTGGTPTVSGSIAGSLLPATTPTTTNKQDSLFKPSDILNLIGLLGGLAGAGAGGGGGGAGGGAGSIPLSDSRIGSTTPQFGDDYYAAIQRYYNSYMPQYPRDVAGPLRQWYENKYGA